MAPIHPCTTFWNPADTPWATQLSNLLALIARADALKMSELTYSTLVNVQQEIEYATNYPTKVIPDHVGGVSPWTPENEALLRAVAECFLAGLAVDQFDDSPGFHTTPLAAGWILSGTPKPGGLTLLRGPAAPPAGGVLGKVRNALGS